MPSKKRSGIPYAQKMAYKRAQEKENRAKAQKHNLAMDALMRDLGSGWGAAKPEDKAQKSAEITNVDTTPTLANKSVSKNTDEEDEWKSIVKNLTDSQKQLFQDCYVIAVKYKDCPSELLSGTDEHNTDIESLRALLEVLSSFDDDWVQTHMQASGAKKESPVELIADIKKRPPKNGVARKVRCSYPPVSETVPRHWDTGTKPGEQRAQCGTPTHSVFERKGRPELYQGYFGKKKILVEIGGSNDHQKTISDQAKRTGPWKADNFKAVTAKADIPPAPPMGLTNPRRGKTCRFQKKAVVNKRVSKRSLPLFINSGLHSDSTGIL